MTAYVMLGKHGDILSALPFVHHEFKITGQKPTLIVAREYSSMIARLNYLVPVVWNNGWRDLREPIRAAKQNFSRVLVPQIYGDGFPIQHRHPSWQYDQWDRVGMLDKWDTLPLVLPRNRKVPVPKVPFVIFADYSESSPFPYKEELALLIKEIFPRHKLIRTSEFKMDKLLDFLPLYDRADLVVTVETAHLHLSKATDTPVIAFSMDKPSVWHGSAWSKRFKFHVRYGEYELRKPEVIRAMMDAINNTSEPRIEIQKTNHPGGFNMGIIWHRDELLKSHRYYPHSGWQTRLAINDEPVEFSHVQSSEGVEDMRLFHFKGNLMASWVVSRAVGAQWRCVVEYGPLAHDEKGWRVGQVFRPVYLGNDFSTMQKNWVFFEHDSQLYAIYGIKNGNQVVLKIEGNNVLNEYLSTAPKWPWGEMRGGAMVLLHGNYLRVFHSRTEQGRDYRYYMGVLMMEAFPPFKVFKVSNHPILAGNEEYDPANKRCKRNCVLPFGIVREGDDFKIGMGLNDMKSAIVSVKENEMNLC